MKSVVIAVVIVALLGLAFAGFRYVDAAVRMQDNLAYQIKSSSDQPETATNEQGQRLMVSNLELERLEQQQFEALVIGGGALIVLAITWAGYDFVSGRRKKAPVS